MCPPGFERLIVARSLSTWSAADESVSVQIANTSSEYLAIHGGSRLGKSSQITIVDPEQLNVLLLLRDRRKIRVMSLVLEVSWWNR